MKYYGLAAEMVSCPQLASMLSEGTRACATLSPKAWEQLVSPVNRLSPLPRTLSLFGERQRGTNLKNMFDLAARLGKSGNSTGVVPLLKIEKKHSDTVEDLAPVRLLTICCANEKFKIMVSRLDHGTFVC